MAELNFNSTREGGRVSQRQWAIVLTVPLLPFAIDSAINPFTSDSSEKAMQNWRHLHSTELLRKPFAWIKAISAPSSIGTCHLALFSL